MRGGNAEIGASKCSSQDPLVIKVGAANNLLFDRHGSLWITDDTSGVFRLPHPELLTDRKDSRSGAALERMTSNDGLSADNTTPVLEDREGNIWVATRDGLD